MIQSSDDFGTQSCSKRSTVDSRRSASRIWTLALSHPARVASDACGGPGTDAYSRTRTRTHTRTRTRTDRYSEPFRTAALFTCTCH